MVTGLWGHACFGWQCQPTLLKTDLMWFAAYLCFHTLRSTVQVEWNSNNSTIFAVVGAFILFCGPYTSLTPASSTPTEWTCYPVLPDMFSMDQSKEAEVDHVPWGAVFIPHQIQSHGNMWVTVVTTEVVLWRKQRVQITTGVFTFVKPIKRHVHETTYIPSCACTPLKHRVPLCPRRWSHWRTLC